MSDNLFEKASRLKLRFPTSKGLITLEDLWDIPLVYTGLNKGIVDSTTPRSLNELAKIYSKQLKDEEEDFVEDKSPAKEKVELAFQIVKYIIEVKKAEKIEKDEAAEKASRKQKLMELIAQKEDETLGSKTLEELKAELASL